MTLSITNKFLKLLSFFLIFSLLSGCQIDSKPKSELDQIRKRGVLRVGTVNNQLSYFIGPDGPSGIDYELAQKFAKELGVRLEIKSVYRISGLFPALKRGEIDIVAAGQAQTGKRIKMFRAGPAYYYVSQQVVYRQGQWKPDNIDEVINKQNELREFYPNTAIFNIVDNSQYEHTLNQIKQQHPTFNYKVDRESDVNDLLRQISQGKLLFTLADSADVSLAQRIYPDLASAFDATEDQPIAWFTRRSDDESLYALMIEFFGKQKQNGFLASLEEKYFGHVDNFDYIDTKVFIRSLDTRLPKWTPIFKKNAGEFDWRLIAAVSYQESHWNPNAKSPTGVRGMMMLTIPTAKIVGVSNRLDPTQSIRGGIEYLRRLVALIPDSIPEHEKIWFALASYNLGYGHVMDVRRITQSLGGDPNSWSDVKENLPLLRQQKYFSKTRYGYARGNEAKAYVENIRQYYQSIIGHVAKKESSTDTNVDDLPVIPNTIPDERINEVPRAQDDINIIPIKPKLPHKRQ